MKAMVYTKYGPPDVLQLKEVEKPAPKSHEVLVRVHAASVNAADLDLVRGTFMIRFGSLLRPRYRILGSDIAGVVESTGRNAGQFRPGDDVFGDLTEYGFGAFAEYACVPEDALVLKPAGMAFEDAAAVPTAGGIALLNLNARARIQPGQKVLINGAGGGMGTFALQMAKSYGAEVTGVDSTGKLDMIRSIGADHVIDYTREDYTKSGRRYDFILDVAAHRSIFDCRRALAPEGVYAVVGGSTSAIFQAVFLGPWISKGGSQKMGILMAYPKKKDLESVRELLETGKVKPVIDRRYPLSKVSEALEYLEEGRALGKVVITVAHNGKA